MTQKRAYAVTLKFQNNSLKTLPSDYIEVITGKWYSLGCRLSKVAFERDSKGMYHMHGIVDIPTSLYHPKLRVKGLQPYIKPITNEAGWLGYMRKSK